MTKKLETATAVGSNSLICPTCSLNLGKPSNVVGRVGWSKRDLLYRDDAGRLIQGHVTHCEGGEAFAGRFKGEPHHTHKPLHPPCWKCGTKLGCPRCVSERELLCFHGGRRGHGGLGPVWASLLALREHGILPGQSIDDYPEDWRRRYGHQEYDCVGVFRPLSGYLTQLYEAECRKLKIKPRGNIGATIAHALGGIDHSVPREPGEEG